MSCFSVRSVLCITHAWTLAIERCSWYLFRRGQCKTSRETTLPYINACSIDFVFNGKAAIGKPTLYNSNGCAYIRACHATLVKKWKVSFVGVV